jgi:hypothetical protein
MYPNLPSSLPLQPDRGLVSQLLTSAQAGGRCWRVLLAWWLLLSSPSLLMGWPGWRQWVSSWDHTILALSDASGWNVPVLVETLAGVGGPRAYAPLGLAVVLTLLVLSPWCTGMLSISFRHPGVPRWRDLIFGGLREAPRMARMLVWSLALMALILLAGVMVEAGGEGALGFARAQPPSSGGGGHGEWKVRVLILALLLVVHLAAEAGRAHLVVQPRRRSAVMAWFRGLTDVLRRPVRVMLLYVGLLAAGVLLWAFFNALHLAASPMAAAWLVGQIAALALVWSRVARLRAMVELARVART